MVSDDFAAGEVVVGWQAKSSRNAGDYVCNLSMYVMLDDLRRHCPDTRFGFVHVPHDYNAERAVRFVCRMLRETIDNRSKSIANPKSVIPACFKRESSSELDPR